MKRTSQLAAIVAFLAAGIFLAEVVGAQPANNNSTRIASFGTWSVVAKQSRYVIVETGQTGTRKVCSAFLVAPNASLEFEVKNNNAWGVYVSASGWNYPQRRGRLSIKSGSVAIRLNSAVYGGPMISAASHDLSASQQVHLDTLNTLAAQGQAISFFDNRNKKLVTFPNGGTNLQRALQRAMRC